GRVWRGHGARLDVAHERDHEKADARRERPPTPVLQHQNGDKGTGDDVDRYRSAEPSLGSREERRDWRRDEYESHETEEREQHGLGQIAREGSQNGGGQEDEEDQEELRPEARDVARLS